MRLIPFTVRISLGGLFLYAGSAKIGSPQSFADSIASFRLLPVPLIDPAALGLPPLEILLGLWLISGWQRRQAAFSTLALTGFFLLALASALVRGIPVDCGCFGTGGDPLLGSAHTGVAVARDAGLSAAAAFLYGFAWREKREHPATG